MFSQKSWDCEKFELCQAKKEMANNQIVNEEY